MNLFPVLEECVQFNGTQEEAASKLRELVQTKKPWIIEKYTSHFYGVVSKDKSQFRSSHLHAGYYWFHAVLTPNEHGTLIRFQACMPKWRRVAYIVVLSLTIPTSLAIPFFVPTWKDLHVALYPLLFAWGAWSGKRDDYRRCAQFMPTLLNAFIPNATASAP